MRLFQNYTEDPAKASLAHQVRAIENDDHQREEKLNSSCTSVNYLLLTKVIKDVIAEAEAKIMNFKEPEYTSAVRYSEVLSEKALRRRYVYKEGRLKGFFTEWLHDSVRFSMQTY